MKTKCIDDTILLLRGEAMKYAGFGHTTPNHSASSYYYHLISELTIAKKLMEEDNASSPED